MSYTTVFTTQTGSRYEVDVLRNRARRLEGTRAPTPHMVEDGTWKDYVEISDIEVGFGVSFIWRFDNTDDGLIARRTVTSRVTAIANHQPN